MIGYRRTAGAVAAGTASPALTLPHSLRLTAAAQAGARQWLEALERRWLRQFEFGRGAARGSGEENSAAASVLADPAFWMLMLH